MLMVLMLLAMLLTMLLHNSSRLLRCRVSQLLLAASAWWQTRQSVRLRTLGIAPLLQGHLPWNASAGSVAPGGRDDFADWAVGAKQRRPRLHGSCPQCRDTPSQKVAWNSHEGREADMLCLGGLASNAWWWGREAEAQHSALLPLLKLRADGSVAASAQHRVVRAPAVGAWPESGRENKARMDREKACMVEAVILICT